jgi:hypothetical protein
MLQRQQLLLVERGKSGALDAAQVAAEPFTHSTFTISPVSGSISSILELVLPPAKFVMRRSEPSRFER